MANDRGRGPRRARGFPEAVQALAGVLLPSASMFLMLLGNDREVLGPGVNRTWVNALAVVIEAVLLLLWLILMATTVFPNLDVTAFARIGGAVMAVGLLVFGGVAAAAGRRGSGAAVTATRPGVPGDLPAARDRAADRQGRPARGRLSR